MSAPGSAPPPPPRCPVCINPSDPCHRRHGVQGWFTAPVWSHTHAHTTAWDQIPPCSVYHPLLCPSVWRANTRNVNGPAGGTCCLKLRVTTERRLGITQRGGRSDVRKNQCVNLTHRRHISFILSKYIMLCISWGSMNIRCRSLTQNSVFDHIGPRGGPVSHVNPNVWQNPI